MEIHCVLRWRLNFLYIMPNRLGFSGLKHKNILTLNPNSNKNSWLIGRPNINYVE
jgi:hypothetical protein